MKLLSPLFAAEGVEGREAGHGFVVRMQYGTFSIYTQGKNSFRANIFLLTFKTYFTLLRTTKGTTYGRANGHTIPQTGHKEIQRDTPDDNQPHPRWSHQCRTRQTHKTLSDHHSRSRQIPARVLRKQAKIHQKTYPREWLSHLSNALC